MIDPAKTQAGKHKEAQRLRDTISGLMRREVRIAKHPDALSELAIAVTKINKRYHK